MRSIPRHIDRTRVIKTAEGVVLWQVVWAGDGVREIPAIYEEGTYLERIAPRVREAWTLDEIYALED